VASIDNMKTTFIETRIQDENGEKKLFIKDNQYLTSETVSNNVITVGKNKGDGRFKIGFLTGIDSVELTLRVPKGAFVESDKYKTFSATVVEKSAQGATNHGVLCSVYTY
jgi:hypothetical protein